jgi:hypothetical protein
MWNHPATFLFPRPREDFIAGHENAETIGLAGGFLGYGFAFGDRKAISTGDGADWR